MAVIVLGAVAVTGPAEAAPRLPVPRIQLGLNFVSTPLGLWPIAQPGVSFIRTWDMQKCVVTPPPGKSCEEVGGMRGFSWGRVEPDSRRYQWEFIDEVLDGATHLHMTPVITLFGTAPWAHPGCTVRYQGSCTVPPNNRRAWERYCVQIAHRVHVVRKINTAVYEIWNEPFSGSTRFLGDASTFAAMTTNCAKAIKANHPHGSTILANGFARTEASKITRLRKQGWPSRYVDAISFHPYRNGHGLQDPAAITARFRQVLQGLNKPLWATETGYHYRRDRPPPNRAQRAKAVKYIVTRLRHARVRVVLWYAWQDPHRASENYDGIGLQRFRCEALTAAGWRC